MKKAYYFHGDILRFVFFKHYCPKCRNLLIRKIHHKLLHSNSMEAKKYESMYSVLEGGYLFGNFVSDVRHHVFYCTICDSEFEHKTLFSYEKTNKEIFRLMKSAERFKCFVHVMCLDECGKETNGFDVGLINKIMISLIVNGKKIERECYIACKSPAYEQSTYFKPTEHLKEIKSLLKTIPSN